MAPSFSRVSSGALLLALAYNARPVNADYWEDVDNCKLVLDDLPVDLTTEFCNDWTYGYEPEGEYVTVTGYPVTVTEYPDAKTCEGEGYSTTTKYPESTPEPSKGYQPPKPTKVPDKSTKVPDESTKVPADSTKAPDQPPATDVPGGYDVTVTSTTTTTYWTTSTIYEGYPTQTPAPYRRHARDLDDRAAWCVDRPCRLVQYDDNTIVEACKKYLGWEPYTSTVNVPGYTVTITSYPTDCKKKEDSYKPDPVPAYPPVKEEDYKPEPYPTETPEPYPAEDDYPTKTPEYEPEPYSTDPPPYPEHEPDYDNGPSYDDGSYDDGSYDDGQYDDGNTPWDNDGPDGKQPWENDFDNNYSGPDGPLPWDDVDQTSELADAIEGSGYEDATKNLGLDNAPWKRDYPTEEDYESYGEDGVDSETPYDNGSDDYDVVHPEEYPPNVYGPDVDESSDYSDNYQGDDYAPNSYGSDVPDFGSYPEDYSEDYSEDSDDGSNWVLPDSSEY